jgi:transcriptional regulator with XRE-family HTH domain
MAWEKEFCPMSKNELGSWLFTHRKKADLTQSQAAKKAGISRTQWARIESGESGTKRNQIPSLAKAVKACR